MVDRCFESSIALVSLLVGGQKQTVNLEVNANLLS